MYFFEEKADVAIRFMLTMLICGELYMGIWSISLYRDNYMRYEAIGHHIRCMPTIWMIQVAWNVVDFLLSWSLFSFYRNTREYGSLVDGVTFLLLVLMLLYKPYAFVFIHLRYTIISLIMLILILSVALGLMLVFALNDKWAEFGYIIVFPLWHLFLVYLNFTWIRVEHQKRAGIL